MNSLAVLGASDIVLKKPVEYLTREELDTLKRACQMTYERSKKTENNEWIRDRDSVLLSLMWVTGGRISDCLTFSDKNLNIKDRTLTFIVKKRKNTENKHGNPKPFEHTITLDNETLFEIMEYTRKWEMKGLLFPARRESKKQLTRQAINKKLREYTDLMGIRRINPHMFRHGLAMFLQAQGLPIEAISFRLAHSSTLITLQIYARMSASQERSIIESLGVRLR